MEQDDGRRDAVHAYRRAESPRLGAARGNPRVAAAAQAALDGLKGVRHDAEPRDGELVRSPGVGVFFEAIAEPVAEPGAERILDPLAEPAPESLRERASEPTRERASEPTRKPASEPTRERPPGPTREPATEPSPGASSESNAGVDDVWNPFRQARVSESRDAVGRPRISNLHTRRNATEATAIATLEYGGRLAHGTAVGSPALHGMLRAVAEATVAALRVVVDEPIPVGVDHVTLSAEGEPATVSVVVSWANPQGEDRLVGVGIVQDDPERAVMHATLNAVERRLGPLLPLSDRSPTDRDR